MNRSRKDVAMMVAIGALLVFAMYNFVFRPQTSELSTARGELRSVEQSVSDAQLALQTPVDASVPIADPGAAPPAVPDDPAMAQLLRQLQAVADQTGVTLAAVDPTRLSENPSGPGGSLAVSITASGPHASVRAYLAALRDLERLLVIEQIADNIQLATAEQPQQSDQIQLSVRVFTLQQPPSAAVPVEAPATP